MNSLLAPVFVAGFYYKTFMWPAGLWEKVYEPAIRRAAGLGRGADHADPDTYEKATAFCDVLVIGAGPAGLTAALTAARSGARVVLADENFALGGRCLDQRHQIGGHAAPRWVSEVEAELSAAQDVRIMRRTTVFGAYDGGTYGAVERISDHLLGVPQGLPRQRMWRLIAKHAILAAGATERPIVFGGNDLPGVMLAGSVRTYVNRFGVVPGSRAIVFANNDDAATAVTALESAGAEVVALIDYRPEPPSGVRGIAEAAHAELIPGGVIVDAIGRKRVSGAVIRGSNGAELRLDCDLIAVSGGWNPNIQLTTHLGGKPSWNERISAFTAGALPPGMSVAGAAGGAFALNSALVSGSLAGAAAAAAVGFEPAHADVAEAEPENDSVVPLWRVRGSRGKAFVDFQNDVTPADIELAEREGFRSVEHLKRYTTLGMGTEQGKTASVNGVAILAEIKGKSLPETGVPIARPPYTPVAIGALAGHHRGRDFKPARLPPSYFWAKEQGAVFVEAGFWLRPSHFPRGGERDWLETVTREVTTVRSAVGICDVSTLGKVDIQGAHAAAFLDKIYMNGMKNLAVGRARYGIMLREDGIVMDDGTIARLADDHYFVTTTTANADKVFQHLQFCHQWLWPELDVQMVPVTEQWAQYAVAGPRSRDLLRKIVAPAFDISNRSFPYLAAGEITVCGGVKARLFRLSFSGERAYEIAVPARFGESLMRRLMEAGQEFGAVAYGTEALNVMRIEKGHVSGPELNGTTTPKDLGLGGMASTNKDYIGRTLSSRPGLKDETRPSLVGIQPVDRSARLWSGAHFIARDAKAVAANDEGYVTSVAFSPSAGHWIGLGLLSRGPVRTGEIIRACDRLCGADTLVEVVSPVFYDPTGARLRD